MIASTEVNGFSNQGASTSTAPLAPGLYVPTVAFFTPEDGIDEETTAAHAKRLVEAGVTGIVTHGSNGEAVHLDHAERQLVTRITRSTMDAAGKPDMPLIVGCGSQSTRETIQLCREAAESGGTHALVLPPAYYGSLLSTDLIMLHFQTVADASPIPLLIYNFPGACSGLDLSSDTILALAEHPNIVGVKLTCGNTGKLARVVAGTPPKACAEVMRLWTLGKTKEATLLQGIVAGGDWTAIKGGFVSVKAALRKYYGYGGEPRKPCAFLEGKALETQMQGFSELIETEKKLDALA
ncbi:aldolase [Trichoderma longibrachiatum ATCC 18648]|uniref:Aldolase n=1 Tax=Trichoderma longibrachiatum ATCC 18648 TaxID=983965 RepID=A0A2T4BW25_TRILO|nr:aldolase [Trichoderma longibrachiatum ATCC 18648]